ncbi:MAG TPA: GH1 family beta-glucosidase [Candidatus Limnocylindrales bacterium]|nr:GH1 family beta-glucosidase [Candidatus Limnocylindrales bacterium]
MADQHAFPGDFLWGAATSAYQVEGAARQDGRGESIWDRFVRRPGVIEDGSTGDVACDHYHRWSGDLDLMARLGLRAYRFSIAWPRVQPTGRGAINRAGLDFYSRLVDGLLAAGITPFATMYHWDLPAALQDVYGGWRHRDTAERFGDYAEAVLRELGDRVPYWITLNEPWVSAFLGYHVGVHAPGERNLAGAVAAAHHLLLGHGRATAIFRGLGLSGKIGITLDLQRASPASDSAADAQATVLADGMTNRWFLDPVLRGRYPADATDLVAAHGASVEPLVEPGDLEAISERLDFLGVNYYFRRLVRASRDGLGWTDIRLPHARFPDIQMPWNVDPDGLSEQLVRLRDEYAAPSIYVTENGIALSDAPGPDGRIDDRQRIDYLADHIDAVRRAHAAGVDVRGYFAWSLLDNFEWAYGYRPRFGLVHVDFASLRRTPKASFDWYARLIARAGAG